MTPFTERNRQNAQHSTGPCTPEGKAISSRNARKHGLSVTRFHLLPNEDPEEYAAFEEEIVSIYNPKSERERLAAIDIAKARWVLRRFEEAEMVLLNARLGNQEQTPGEALAYACITDPTKPQGADLPSLDLLMRYCRHWERRHQDAIREFDRARAERHREERLAMAQEREAAMQAARQQRQAAKEPRETRAERNYREMSHLEYLLGFRTPDGKPIPGFVSPLEEPKTRAAGA
jgi:hypothetical protein